MSASDIDRDLASELDRRIRSARQETARETVRQVMDRVAWPERSAAIRRLQSLQPDAGHVEPSALQEGREP